MSLTDTYSLAHSARCKLQLAADRPDRNLRFILGHAFTLDKLRLRIAEIEMDSSDDDDINGGRDATRERRVSFRGKNNHPTCGESGTGGAHGTHGTHGTRERKRSPPPDQFADLEDTDSESDEDEGEDEEGDGNLSLRRFESGSARQPQMIEDDSSSSDEDEPISPPPIPSEDELRIITEGAGDTELAGLYHNVAGCPCHGHNAPGASQVWEIPQKPGHTGGRFAVVEVGA